jgi:hypothetical protein
MVETEMANTFAISLWGMPCFAAPITRSLRSVEYAGSMKAYSPLNIFANRYSSFPAKARLPHRVVQFLPIRPRALPHLQIG